MNEHPVKWCVCELQVLNVDIFNNQQILDFQDIQD